MNRTLATQIALGAAFGTALAWRRLQVRRLEEASAAAPVPITSAAPNGRPANAAHSRGSGSLHTEPDGLNDRIRWIVFIVAAAAIPILIGVTYALNRSHDEPAAASQVVVPLPTTAPTLVAAPTATLSEALFDTRRVIDLATVRQAADAYAGFFGRYPSTGGKLQPLCTHADDAGCAIGRYATSFPTSDGAIPYWYASDGTTLTLVAEMTTPPRPNECPPGLTEPLGNVPVLCVRSHIPSR